MTKTKALLMALVLLCGGMYVLQMEDAGDEGEDKARPILQDAAATIQSVELTEGESSFTLQRADDGWRLKDLPDASVDQETVSAILYGLDSMVVRNRIGALPESERASFGLDSPTFSVRVSHSAGVLSIDFGKKHAFSGRRYASISPNDDVVLIDESSVEAIRRSQYEVREKNVLAFDLGKVARVEVQPRDGLPLSLLKKEGGQWMVESMQETRDGDSDLITDILKRVSEFKAAEFIDAPEPNEEKYGLSAPVLRLSVRGADGEELLPSIHIGEIGEDEEKQIFIKRENEERLYKASSRRVYARLLQPAYYFRDATPFDSIDIAKVKEVEVRSFDNHQETFTIRATDEVSDAGRVWAVVDFDGNGAVADEGSVLDFLDALFTLRMLYVATGEQKGLDGELKLDRAIDIKFFGDDDAIVSYRLIIAGEVQNARAASANSEPELAPRHGTLRLGDGDFAVPVIIRSESWKRLNKQREDLLPTTE